MEEEFKEELEDVSHLPLIQRMQHKQMGNKEKGWTDCASLLASLPNNDPQFREYAPFIRKTLKERSPKLILLALSCLEPLTKGCALEDNEYHDLFNHIGNNLLNHTSKSIVSQCHQVLSTCIETEQNDAVVDACVKAATSSKTPKVHEANVAYLVTALKDYGPSVINLRKVKPVLSLVTSANSNVRNECRNLIMEMYRWAKDDLKPLLKDLPEKNLPKESEFESLKSEKPEPVKFTQKVLKEKERLVTAGADPSAILAATAAVDCLQDPVDIFKKVPNLMKELHDKTALKSTLPTLSSTLEANKLLIPSLNYDDLIKTLLNIAITEARFMLSVDACKSLTQLALKVPNSVSPHASKAIPELIKRSGFRQKSLIDAIAKTLDTLVPIIRFDKFLDLVTESLEDKKPDIVWEAGELIARCVPRCPEAERPKKLSSGLVNALAKAFSCSKVEARDAAMKAAGALLKLTGDKALQAQCDKLDNAKKAKIKDFKDQCSINGGGAVPQSTSISVVKARVDAPANIKAAKETTPVEDVPKVIKGPTKTEKNSSAPSKTTSTITRPAGGKKKATTQSKLNAKGGAGTVFSENVLSEEDAVSHLEGVASDSVKSQLTDGNWKTRLAAVEELKMSVAALDGPNLPVQAITRLITKKPGLKDNNFQVLKVKIEILNDIFSRGNVSLHTLDACMIDLTEKLADLKNSTISQQALLSLAESTSLDIVSTQVLETAFAHKSPKVQCEALNWLSVAIREFGFKVPAKSCIDTMKTALSASNPVVRTSAVKLFGVMYMYLKAPLRGFFESEKPAVQALLDAEIEKTAGETPPTPIRGVQQNRDNGAGGDGMSEVQVEETIDTVDLLPRADISGKLQGDLICEMCDSNWKVRLEALQKVQAIVNEARVIGTDLGELPKALKARIGDTNKNLASNAIKLSQQLIEAMGPNGVKHSHIFLPAIMAALADSKPQLRLTAISSLDKWFETSRDGLNMFLDGDKLSDALRTENPFLRCDLLEWFSGKLEAHTGKVSKELLATCVIPVYSCIEDRNGEVRKKGQTCLLPLGKLVGYNILQQRCNSLPPSSRQTILKHLEAIRGEINKNEVTSAPPAATQGASKRGESREAKLTPNNPSTFVRKPSNLAKTAPSEPSEEAQDEHKEEKRGKSKEEELHASSLFSNIDLRAVTTRKDGIRWVIHDNKNLEKDKQALLFELKKMFEVCGASTPCINLTFSEMLPQHQKITDLWIQALRDESTQDMMLSNRDLIIRWGAVHCYDKNWMTINHFMKFLLELFPIMADRNISLENLEVNILLPNFLSKFVSMTSQSQELVDNVMRSLPMVCKPTQIFLGVAEMLKNQKNYKLAKNMIDELCKLLDAHREEIRRLPNLKVIVKSCSQFTSQSNMKELTLKAIAELCFIKEGTKDQKEMLREVTDKDRSGVEKYLNRLREERPQAIPRESFTEVRQPSSPARLGRPSASTQIYSPSNNRIPSRGSIGRGIPSPRMALSPIAASAYNNPSLDLNAVNNNQISSPHILASNHQMQQGGFVDPSGTFVRPPGFNRSHLAMPRTMRFSSPPMRAVYDADNFEKISRQADLVLKKEEHTRLITHKVSLGSSALSNTIPPDEHFISKKLNCTSIENVIDSAQQIQHSLQNSEMDGILPEVNEQFVNSLFSNVGQQWNTVLTLYIPDDTSREENIRQVIRSLGACVYVVITTGSYAKLASQSSLEALIPSAFALLSHEYMEKFVKPGSASSDVQKLLNDIIVKSLDKTNATRITCTILRIYTERVSRKHVDSDKNSRSCLDLMTKCLWKLVRHWKQRLPDDLEVLPILRTANECLTVFSSLPSSSCDFDKEQRTVKSVVTELYNHYENMIWEQVNSNFGPESEILKCIHRIKKSKDRYHNQEKDRSRLHLLVSKFKNTGDLEELIIHILVEDIHQDEILRLISEEDHIQSIKAVFNELPNIRKTIEVKGFPENFGYLSSEAVTEIMRYLEKIWDLPGMTPVNMTQIIDEARNRPCANVAAETRRHMENAKKHLAELNDV